MMKCLRDGMLENTVVKTPNDKDLVILDEQRKLNNKSEEILQL